MQLSTLRKQFEELQNGAYQLMLCEKEQLVFKREGKNVSYILLNQNAEAIQIKLDLETDVYVDGLNQEEYQVTSPTTLLTLEGYSAMILTKKQREEII